MKSESLTIAENSGAPTRVKGGVRDVEESDGECDRTVVKKLPKIPEVWISATFLPDRTKARSDAVNCFELEPDFLLEILSSSGIGSSYTFSCPLISPEKVQRSMLQIGTASL